MCCLQYNSIKCVSPLFKILAIRFYYNALHLYIVPLHQVRLNKSLNQVPLHQVRLNKSLNQVHLHQVRLHLVSLHLVRLDIVLLTICTFNRSSSIRSASATRSISPLGPPPLGPLQVRRRKNDTVISQKITKMFKIRISKFFFYSYLTTY